MVNTNPQYTVANTTPTNDSSFVKRTNDLFCLGYVDGDVTGMAGIRIQQSARPRSFLTLVCRDNKKDYETSVQQTVRSNIRIFPFNKLYDLT